jgi:hypothetical protein
LTGSLIANGVVVVTFIRRTYGKFAFGKNLFRQCACQFTFTAPARIATFSRDMKRFLSLALFCLLFTGVGCTSTSLTNLTPRQQTRNANGLYPVEALWESNQATVVSNSIKGFVVVGENAYPMERSPMLPTRWETVLPVPADKDHVNFRFRFDYEYLQIQKRSGGNVWSAPYQMQIVDR